MRRDFMAAMHALACVLWLAFAAHATGVAAPSTPARFEPAVDWDAFHYARAVDCWTRGDLRAAAGHLERIDVTPASRFAHADRAAFLLATAYLQLDDTRAFERTAARAGTDTGSPWRRWIRYCMLLHTASRAPGGPDVPAAPAGFAGAALMQAALLVESGRPQQALSVLDSSDPSDELASLHLYVRALARHAAGQDATPDWDALAARTPQRALEADLVGRAAIESATARRATPAHAIQALASVPEQSRYYPYALQLRATLAMEKGDTAAAAADLRKLQHDHPGAPNRRDARVSLGASMMGRGHWYAALRYFESANDAWHDESRSLDQLAKGDHLDAAWDAWRRRASWTDEIRLAPEALLAAVSRDATQALALSSGAPDVPGAAEAATLWPGVETSALAAWDSAGVLERHAPTSDEWERVRALEQAASQARSDLAREDARIAERILELDRRGRYLGRGEKDAVASADTIEAAIARLDTLILRLDATLAGLARVRDDAVAHVAARTREMVGQLRDEVVFMRALRHFHVEGPQRDRPEVFPGGTPSTAEILAREEALALQATAFLEFFSAHYTGVIRLSFERAWRPHLAADSRALRTALRGELARARSIGAALDSTLAALSADSELAAMKRRRDGIAQRSDSLDVAAIKTRREITAAVVTRARASLAAESEAIDYHLADATYEIAVQAATDSATAEQTEVVGPLRDRAIARAGAFIERYPSSPSRSETRYRLADLELLRARDDFRSRMAGFLGNTPSSDDIQKRALAPFVDYAPAIAQYEAILREDPQYAHIDAVLFNLGMIRADEGHPDAMRHLARLVSEFPASPDVQEAWLRMGNDHFDRRDFAGAIPPLEQAVKGADPSFTAMAYYRLGWSQFEQDRFDDAAASFGSLIDHYGRHGEIARKMDLRQEAEECLVHTLARAGGAQAFVRQFARAGRRDYEPRVLTALAALLRGSSLYGDAVACEELWLARYPDHPDAFTVAQRLVDTYQRWNKPDLARAAKRAQAERFVPGSAWQKAQKDPQVREEAERFARGAYRETAAQRHAQARRGNDAAQWRDALAQYETYLSHWPDEDDSPRLHFLASDAAAHLGEYPQAMRHLNASMASDSLALVHEAAWQRVAVADAWYRRSQRASGGSTGSDSLAAVVLKTGDEFTSRFSNDPRCADVTWRQGNVALAHGRDGEAATRLEGFATRFPADRRALPAVVRSADARYRMREFDAAGATYEKALAMARTAKRDSLATALETTVPTCYYQHAESLVRADSTKGEREAAPLFARVARDWPRFRHADLALYRAGLGYASAKKPAEAAAAWEELLRVYPKSEYARDSAAQIAVTLEALGRTTDAAAAYERFAAAYPKDPDAPGAMLKAADLRASGGDIAGAERTRTQFLAAFPGEFGAAMEIRASRAQKELNACADGARPVSALLAKKSSSDLKAYLDLAEKHPELARPEILAQCDFLRAEEAHTRYVAARLTQPLPASIEKKKAHLEETIALYEKCSKHGLAEYTRASAHRIGQSLIEFGDALAASERPAGLTEEDLAAYNEVLTEQSYAFYDRGEDAWSTLLRQSARDRDDEGGWLARTREALWPRLGERFLFRPEVDYPLVRAGGPAREKQGE
jgi:tetratricopeptide (TPR) repeat protein